MPLRSCNFSPRCAPGVWQEVKRCGLGSESDSLKAGWGRRGRQRLRGRDSCCRRRQRLPVAWSHLSRDAPRNPHFHGRRGRGQKGRGQKGAWPVPAAASRGRSGAQRISRPWVWSPAPSPVASSLARRWTEREMRPQRARQCPSPRSGGDPPRSLSERAQGQQKGAGRVFQPSPAVSCGGTGRSQQGPRLGWGWGFIY